MTVLINPYRFGSSGGGGGGITDPDDISGLVVWYDARLESFSDGDPVGTVTDHSTAGNTTTSVNGSPSYATGVTPGGEAAFQFGGAAENDWINVDVSIDIQSATTFVFFASDIDHASSNTWAFYGRGGTSQRWYAPYLNSNDFAVYTGGSSARTILSSFSTATWYGVAVRADGNSKEAWVDGVSALTWSDTNTGNATDTRLAGGNDDFDGYIALFLQYDSALTDQEVSDVFDWIDANF